MQIISFIILKATQPNEFREGNEKGNEEEEDEEEEDEEEEDDDEEPILSPPRPTPEDIKFRARRDQARADPLEYSPPEPPPSLRVSQTMMAKLKLNSAKWTRQLKHKQQKAAEKKREIKKEEKKKKVQPSRQVKKQMTMEEGLKIQQQRFVPKPLCSLDETTTILNDDIKTGMIYYNRIGKWLDKMWNNTEQQVILRKKEGGKYINAKMVYEKRLERYIEDITRNRPCKMDPKWIETFIEEHVAAEIRDREESFCDKEELKQIMQNDFNDDQDSCYHQTIGKRIMWIFRRDDERKVLLEKDIDSSPVSLSSQQDHKPNYKNIEFAYLPVLGVYKSRLQKKMDAKEDRCGPIDPFDVEDILNEMVTEDVAEREVAFQNDQLFTEEDKKGINLAEKWIEILNQGFPSRSVLENKIGKDMVGTVQRAWEEIQSMGTVQEGSQSVVVSSLLDSLDIKFGENKEVENLTKDQLESRASMLVLLAESQGDPTELYLLYEADLKARQHQVGGVKKKRRK